MCLEGGQYAPYDRPGRERVRGEDSLLQGTGRERRAGRGRNARKSDAARGETIVISPRTMVHLYMKRLLAKVANSASRRGLLARIWESARPIKGGLMIVKAPWADCRKIGSKGGPTRPRAPVDGVPDRFGR